MRPRPDAAIEVRPAQWISPAQAAEMSGRPVTVLRRYLRAGVITGKRQDGRWQLPAEQFEREISRL